MVDERPSSRDLTWELGLSAPDQLSRIADAQDTKAMGTFATASVIIGVVAAVSRDLDYSGMFFAAFAFFVITAALCLYIVVVRSFQGPDDPRTLREDFWDKEPEEARSLLWGFTEAAFDANRNIVKAKGKALQWAIPSLFVEVVLLLTWLLVTSS